MSQIIVKGIEELSHILKQYNKMLIVHGRSFERYEIKKVFDVLPHAEFVDFSHNPLYEDVCRGVEVFHNESCDVIIAVGGGSAIDVAKCIKLYCRMDKYINYLKQEIKDTGIPLIAIPTTAGTGSESTKHAVIYYEGNKQSVSHDSIIPDYAVLIPELLSGLPVYQKKCTMLDALCQAVESWWSVNSTDESKEYSKKAITGIKENWQAYLDGNDEAASKMLEAANYAGRAINITATTAAHAMSYKITVLYKFPHGHAVAVCMPEVWQHILMHTEDCIDSRGSGYLKDTLAEISELIQPDWFTTFLGKLEMDYPVARDRETELEVLARSVNSARLRNNPVALNERVLKEMYGRILKS